MAEGVTDMLSAKPINDVWSIIVADEADHSRMRKNLSHAFSDKALRQQEPLLQSYVDLLVQRLGEHGAEGKAVDIYAWYSTQHLIPKPPLADLTDYATFDIITDLAFGEPLYCLRDSAHHTWVSLAYASVKASSPQSTRNKYAFAYYYDAFRSLFQDTGASERVRQEFHEIASNKVSTRLAKIEMEGEDGKADFFSHILRNQENDSRKLSRGEMVSCSCTNSMK
jgi:cytochrome P450